MYAIQTNALYIFKLTLQHYLNRYVKLNYLYAIIDKFIDSVFVFLL